MTPDEEAAAARSAAARALGQAKTPRKTATSRASIAAVNSRRDLLECTCGRTDGTHPASCPCGRRQRRARQREAKEKPQIDIG